MWPPEVAVSGPIVNGGSIGAGGSSCKWKAGCPRAIAYGQFNARYSCESRNPVTEFVNYVSNSFMQ